MIGAIVAVGATIGTGLVVQSASASSDRVLATAALANSSGRQHEQLGAYAGIAKAQATQAAKGTLDGANVVIAAAEGKSDATALTVSVASLTHYTLLAPDRVFDLVDETQAQTAALQASTAEADRVAAEAAAAAAAAAAAEAAKAATVASTSTSSRPSAPTDPSGAQAIARDMMQAQYGWGADQFGCLVSLWNKESGWNANSYNASSGATGIPQALPGSKMASAGADWQTNPATQITWGLGYIAGRYGTPCGAWDHSESAGWY